MLQEELYGKYNLFSTSENSKVRIKERAYAKEMINVDFLTNNVQTLVVRLKSSSYEEKVSACKENYDRKMETCSGLAWLGVGGCLIGGGPYALLTGLVSCYICQEDAWDEYLECTTLARPF